MTHQTRAAVVAASIATLAALTTGPALGATLGGGTIGGGNPGTIGSCNSATLGGCRTLG